MKNNDYSIKLNNSISDFFHDALRIIVKKPAMMEFVLQSIYFQKKAAQTRMEYEKQELKVPPYMIISITNRCNLACKGCYSKAQHRPVEKEMSCDRLQSVILEAKGLGISFIFLAGGEPLMRPDILDITNENPEIIFPLFTNGILITDEIITRLRNQRNVVPIISMEGYETDTNERRGSGVYEHLQKTIKKLKHSGIFFGYSFTVTRKNFDTLTDEAFINKLLASGCQLFFFVEYIPVKEATEDLVILEEQRIALAQILDSFRAKFPGLFVSFPGDEKDYGGCLSAGRRFIHVSAEGDVEPCPFAPYSDVNIREVSLKEALQSELMKKIRQNHTGLNEPKGGCALWNKREWVKSLL
ncbi:radical SAM protein [Geosporobacter ferrireducens]|uniref:radical SAM protein n=1 Tax=Geosporobacter ferrireducens TaxID=1424294 RepID=UPI002353A6EE|nr:radical SAM protein [Geosporobacter ferrireducens]